jgi:transcriptional regulator with XRE-family HTH domain
MSTESAAGPRRRRAAETLLRLRVEAGRDAYDERRRRRWSLADVAERAGVSLATAQRVESGHPSSLDAIVAVAVGLGLEPQLRLASKTRRPNLRDADPVHAAMAEIEARELGRAGRIVLIDEPYQHYQFAGRADVAIIDRANGALLHIENRTRFPDIQAMAGAWNAKRAYLGAALAKRERLPAWTSIDHVMVALWSSEVLHTMRLRRHSFDALARDLPHGWASWWTGEPPSAGTRATIVLLDPLPGVRRSRRRWVGLDQIDRVEPRYRGYADALAALRGAGLA